jgi:hypothetical protein
MDLKKSHTVTILNTHRKSFYEAKEFADTAGHTVPCDTKSWSQILVSFITETHGLYRQKGNDLEDGSDVKAANAWDAIDKPRFNGVLKASLDGTDYTYIYFVLWDWVDGIEGKERCRVWYIDAKNDPVFKAVAKKWYDQKRADKIKSWNFQLHPPIHNDSDIVTNECGNLELPLLLDARWNSEKETYEIIKYDEDRSRYCKLVGSAPERRRKT